MQRKNVVNQLNSVMQSRRSVRKYDTSVKIARDEISNILQDATTAPSSLNLQPWRFVVIDSNEGKELIKPYVLSNLLQLETSSAMIAVYGDLNSFSYSNEILSASVAHGVMTEETKDSIQSKLTEYEAIVSKAAMTEMVLIDGGLVSMQIMLAAKAYGYDTNAIGGYAKKELTEALGLDTERYVPIMLLSLGKADDEGYESIRFSIDEITQWK